MKNLTNVTIMSDQIKYNNICFLIIFLFLTITDTYGANRFIDSTATGSNSGTSWANAWVGFNNISSLQPGDTVYISGGPTGSSKTYSVSRLSWTSGTASQPITYKIGQETGHNGTAIFSLMGGE